MRAAVMVALTSLAAPAGAAEVNYAPFKSPAQPEKKVELVDTDHEAVRLRVGAGYFGRIDAPLGAGAVPLHLVGVRTWFRRAVGFDLAVGANVDVGDRSMFALGARASFPIALYVDRHLTLFFAPTVGYAQGGETLRGRATTSAITGLPYTPPDTQNRGLRVSLGGRVGAEIHFGFIGLQRLSLIGSVGLDATFTRTSVRAAPPPSTRDPEPRATTDNDSVLSLRTSFADSLLSNVAIVGYF